MRFHQYWGKTQDGTFHRLSHHSLDVAACAVRLVERRHRVASALCTAMGCTPTALAAIMGWAAALHDLGKLSPAFQRQDDRTAQIADLLGVPVNGQPYDVRHDSLGWELWQDITAESGIETQALERMDAVMRCATGHHGKPPSAVVNGRPVQAARYFTAQERVAACEWWGWATDFFRPDWSTPLNVDAGSWWLAGAFTLVDWIGSNMDWFPYRPVGAVLESDPADYYAEALARADVALDASGVLQQEERRSFAELFPGYVPTPVQKAVSELHTSDGAYLLIVEEATGGGKTEAALAAAGGAGFFFALPTMATANGLWARVEGLGGQQALAHGKRWNMPGAMDRAGAWMNSSSRRVLLSDIGVGTVDQAMIAVMHARYAALRLAGLAGKTLIIDEVHAYDAYMKRVLEVLLELHARSGGAVILLSATLPLAHRRDYARAWCRGRDLAPPEMREAAYPLVSFVGPDGRVTERAGLASRSQEGGAAGRRIRIEWAPDPSVVIQRIVGEVGEGKCVAWIRNTVAEAIAAAAQLQALGLDCRLFHSRFALQDRLDIERAVLEGFGKHSQASVRAGKVLVATQVIEQSLDLDFDFMVTDLCPVDLLLQRAGRLHRHAHRPERGEPVVLVHGPTWAEAPDADWVRRWSGGTAAVYPDPGLLWMTQRVLGAGFAVPMDSRGLIEAVYAMQIDALPAALQQPALKVRGELLAMAMQGGMSAINPGTPYRAEGVPQWDDLAAPTRLGERTVEWVLCEDGVPVCRDIDASVVSLRQSALSSAPAAKILVAPWQKSLNLHRGTAVGERNGRAVSIIYDKRRGLEVR